MTHSILIAAAVMAVLYGVIRAFGGFLERLCTDRDLPAMVLIGAVIFFGWLIMHV